MFLFIYLHAKTLKSFVNVYQNYQIPITILKIYYKISIEFESQSFFLSIKLSLLSDFKQ